MRGGGPHFQLNDLLRLRTSELATLCSCFTQKYNSFLNKMYYILLMILYLFCSLQLKMLNMMHSQFKINVTGYSKVFELITGN